MCNAQDVIIVNNQLTTIGEAVEERRKTVPKATIAYHDLKDARGKVDKPLSKHAHGSTRCPGIPWGWLDHHIDTRGLDVPGARLWASLGPRRAGRFY